MDRVLPLLAIAVFVGPFLLWPAGWLVVDEFRERRIARQAAQGLAMRRTQPEIVGKGEMRPPTDSLEAPQDTDSDVLSRAVWR